MGYQRYTSRPPPQYVSFTWRRAQQLAYLDKKGRSRLAQIIGRWPVPGERRRAPAFGRRKGSPSPSEAPLPILLTAVRGGVALSTAPPAVALAADYEEDDYGLMPSEQGAARG